MGTAAQVPTRERNHNGYFLRWNKSGILFDPGEGTQRQMTYADQKSIPWVAIIGGDELAQQKVMLKNMTSGEQRLVALDELKQILR